MGNFYSEGVRCKPYCPYPYITDEVNEVCICDQVNGYYLMFNSWTLYSCNATALDNLGADNCTSANPCGMC